MQKAINRSDSEVQNRNAIVRGLPEDNIIVENSEIQGDINKIKCILKHTGNQYFSEEDILEFKCSRLGKEKPGYNRVIKVTFPTSKERDEFIKDGHKLKNIGDSIKNSIHNIKKLWIVSKLMIKLCDNT